MVELALFLIAIPIGLLVVCNIMLTVIALVVSVLIGQWTWAAGFLVVLVIQQAVSQWLWERGA